MQRLSMTLVVLGLVVSACGSADRNTSTAAARTVEVDMVDIGFQPAAFTAKPGERVRFVFHNRGKVSHDAFIGDAAAQSEHERAMRQGGDRAGHGHHGMHGDDGGDAITVAPGKTGQLTYTFKRAGTVEVGCHQPGHYAAGMKLDVTVA